jgi:polyvinyl alcohol dehydrogenase (cytochrome)
MRWIPWYCVPVVAFLVGALVSPPALLAADPADWPMYNHDVAGWRFNPAEKTLGPANVGKLIEKWRFPAADSKDTIGVVHATPTVVDGEVYFGTGTFPAFYKLDATGKQKWAYRNPARKQVLPPTSDGDLGDKLASTIRYAGIMSSALVADGAVYFADTGGSVYCLDAATGAERWKVDMRAPSFPGAHSNNLTLCSPILADGKIVIGGGTIEQTYAGTKEYPGSTGRGFVVAFEPKTGAVVWKYDVGEKPQKLDPPVVVKDEWGSYTFTHGPATSSVWSTPSYDAESKRIFFGTDVNTAPRQPTKDNPNLYTEDSDAIVCLDVATGRRQWNTQVYPGDQWCNAMRGWDPKTGLYKDCSIGDTPKIFTIALDGKPTKVVGAGCKNGGFYVLRADSGKIVKHTPIYTGPPTEPPAPHDARVLALPSPIGGLQTGCATDGQTIFTNGIDAVRLTTQAARFSPGAVPTGGRVTATSVDLAVERWRHERAKVRVTAGTPEKPVQYDRGDIVGSGIAVGNGVAYFTAAGSCKLVALDTATGALLREIEIGPVFCGPSLSRGRVYVGGGNTVFTGGARRKPDAAKTAPTIEKQAGGLFPLQIIGSVRCFGLPDESK